MTAMAFENVPACEGEVLDGKYRVDRVIGAGGMGVVVAATHVQLQTQVALKFLLPEVLSNQQVAERFVREARAAVRIQSEHVARVSDVGKLSNGAPYMVMEYLEGQDLADILAKSGPMSVTQAAGYLLQACEAIAEAHALGIVHRDLKPANLFLVTRARREPIIKVLDFGISKTTDAESMGLTNTSALMGSPYYMSPEQMKSARDADARSDIWALGIILYELLTGVPPFLGSTITEIVVSVTQGNVPPVRDVRPDVPAAVEAIIGRCLKRDPRQRYADIAAFAKALVPFGPPRSDAALENITRILGVVASHRPAAPDTPESNRAVNAPIAQATAAAWSNSHSGTRANLRGPLLIGVSAAVIAALTLLAWRYSRPSQRAAADWPSVTTSASSAPQSSVAVPNAQPAAPLALAVTSAEPPPSAPSAQPAAPSASAATSVEPVASAAPAKKNQARVTSATAPRTNKPPVAATPAPTGKGLNMGMKE